jgi:hypothetical protein
VVVVAFVPVALPVMSTFPDKVVEAKRPSVIDGAVPKTREPDPVSSVMSAASFAEVSKEVDDTLSLNTFQSEDARKPERRLVITTDSEKAA